MSPLPVLALASLASRLELRWLVVLIRARIGNLVRKDVGLSVRWLGHVSRHIWRKFRIRELRNRFSRFLAHDGLLFRRLTVTAPRLFREGDEA
ncbi:hypothetical protein ASD52_01925 [Ensifer sp. Root142]|nr:hypothetical protein ASD52_01925 [Ensifer sp. Root142]